jgi:hypothetical protein
VSLVCFAEVKRGEFARTVTAGRWVASTRMRCSIDVPALKVMAGNGVDDTAKSLAFCPVACPLHAGAFILLLKACYGICHAG